MTNRASSPARIVRRALALGALVLAAWLIPSGLRVFESQPLASPDVVEDTSAFAPVTRVQSGPQARGVMLAHRAGQTFVTWRELDPAPPEALTIAEYAALRKTLVEAKALRYRIYRSAKAITRIADAQLLAEVPALSAWNGELYGVNPPATAPVRRYVIANGQPALAPGTGVYVATAAQAGSAFYAVTAVVAGAETTSVSAENAPAAPVVESVGPGVPVLQRTEKLAQFQYIDNPTIRWFVRWETPPNTNVPGRPHDYLVAIPVSAKEPAAVGLHLHGWGGSMSDGFGWWFNAEKGAVLVSTNEIPYDWWTGYHERLGRAPMASPADWARGVVRPYSQSRLLSFVDWLATTMKLDLTRLFVAGNSMGGSGAVMLAIRQPSRIAWTISWVGVHVPGKSPQFQSSYESVFGKPEWGAKVEDGTPVWDYFSDVWYLRHHQGQDIGFITFSNGKNDGAIGWSQAVDFLRALQDTRQPHLFVWGQDGHGQRATMPAAGGERNNPLDLRTDQSLPAFSRGSLDDDPGTGTPESGAPAGQVNAYLTWKTDSIVDEPARWQITLGLTDNAPRAAVVDVTPRRLQRFKLKPGSKVEWTNTPTGGTPQRGEVVADEFGLVTVPRVEIPKAGSRLQLTAR